MSDDLKPCPFCGDERVILCTLRGFPRYECVMCNARGPMMSTDDNARALSDWNTRHVPEPSEAEAWNKRMDELGARKGTLEELRALVSAPTPEQVEAVAKAIDEQIDNPYGWEYLQDAARAAIAAMKGR